jgi:hypothetical protein
VGAHEDRRARKAGLELDAAAEAREPWGGSVVAGACVAGDTGTCVEG